MDKTKSLKILKNLEKKIDNLSPEETHSIIADAKEFFATSEKRENCGQEPNGAK